MSDELKPCPYCGHKPAFFRFDSISPLFPDIEYTVECINSECPVNPSVSRGTEYEATEAWNTRAKEVKE